MLKRQRKGAYPRSEPGFSLVELLMVMFIIGLLCFTAVPALSKLSKTSKIDQAAKTVLAALYHARSEAQHYRTAVGLYYGDGCFSMKPAPVPGVLPGPNSIELWTVDSFDANGNFGTSSPPYFPDNPGSPPAWYPYRFPDRRLDATYVLPDGVRVMTGAFSTAGNKGYFDFPSYRKDNIGEIKRHHSVYTGRGSMPSYLNTYWAWYHVVVFDEASGDHIVIEAGQWQSSTRPRILKEQITNIGSSSKSTPLTKKTDLAKLLDTFAGNS